MTLYELDFDKIEVKGSSIVLPVSHIDMTDIVIAVNAFHELNDIGHDVVYVYLRNKRGFASEYCLEVNLKNKGAGWQKQIICIHRRRFDLSK